MKKHCIKDDILLRDNFHCRIVQWNEDKIEWDI